MKINLIKLYLNFRIFIFPAVVALSSLILIVFIIYPQIVQLIKNQKVQVDVITKSEFLEAKASVLDDLNEGELEAKVASALNSYPAEQDLLNIVGLLQQVAIKSGFSVSEISVQKIPSGTGEIFKFGVGMETVGPESLLSQFIAGIESAVRIMKVSSIDLSPVGADLADISLGIDVFFAPAPQTFGSVDSHLPELSQKDEELIARLTSVPRVSQPASLSPRGKTNPFE